jgi:hypothetical protein
LGLRALRRHDFWFLLALVLIPIATGSLLSFSRFTLTMYPAFIVLAGLVGRFSSLYGHIGILSVLLAGRIIVSRMVSQGAFVA